MCIKDLHKIVNDMTTIVEKIRNKKVIVFGAGEMAKAIISFLSVKISYCVDNDHRKQSKEILGIKIYSPDELGKEKKEEVLVLVASMYYLDISDQLIGMGFSENISFIDAKTLYQAPFYFDSKEMLELMKNYIFMYLSADINIGEYKKILITPKISWLGLSNEKLLLFGLMRKYYLLFVDDEVSHKKNYFDDIDEKYMEIAFEGVNLYKASLYNICFDLKVSVKDIDIRIESHKQRIIYWFNACVEYILYVLPLFEKGNILKVVVFQGHFYEQAILRQLAIKHDIEVLCLENTFNRNKAVWDSVSALTVNNNSARNYYWRYKDTLNSITAQKYVQSYIKKVKELKMPEHNSPDRKYERPLKMKVVLFIGQVYLDSSTVFGIWDYNDTVEIIKILVDYCMTNNTQLVVKLHPKEKQNKHFYKDTLTHMESDDELMSKIRASDQVLVDSENIYDTYSLIDMADVCVTVNSQAGMEALIKSKDVILCGMSSYGGLGFTYEAYNKDMLKCSLNMRLKDNISLIKYDDISKFFYTFNELYCIGKDEVSVLDKIVEGV